MGIKYFHKDEVADHNSDGPICQNPVFPKNKVFEIVFFNHWDMVCLYKISRGEYSI
jgi:hypothetical protein